MRKHRQNYNSNGRTRRKGQEGSKNHGDPFHNGQVPLCRLLTDAIEDIFPELQQQAESGSLLGRMIRKRYLLSRKSHRALQDAKFKIDPLHDSAAWDFNASNSNIHLSKNNSSNGNNKTPPMSNATTPAASTATKKRRKRKKKKKQESDDSFLPSVITNETGGSAFGSSRHSRNDSFVSDRNSKNDSYMSADSKSMMSMTDHSLEALDEAVKVETEKLIELQANHELPLLGSFPSDDSIQVQESPSQFIDQIKPEDEKLLIDYMPALPLIDESPEIFSKLEVDNIPENDDSLDLQWKNPLQLSFLVNYEEVHRYSGNDSETKCGDGRVCEIPKNLMTVVGDKERGRIVLNEWMDQCFFANDESECIETSVVTDQDDDQNDEWDSFLQFCNDRTVGKEKELGIPLGALLEIGSSIQCKVCRDETVAEIVKMKENKVSQKPIVIKPEILEKPTVDDKSIDAAFDYVAMEEGNHVPNSKAEEEEKSESNISFLIKEVTIDPKQKKSTNKNGNKKKNIATNATATERFLYLEPLTSNQLEEFFNEWLIAGVNEEKLAQTCVRNEIGPEDDDRAAFPVVATDEELQKVKTGVIELQIHLKELLDEMNLGLEQMKSEWRSKDANEATEMNLVFSANEALENCEGNCHAYLFEDILPILTGDLSLPSHASPELQIYLWATYLEGLGKTLSACDVYYKKLEQDLADQNGKLPFIFTSAPFRKIYRELAEEKIGFLSELAKAFSSVLSSCSLKEFYTRSTWEIRDQDDEDLSQKLDDDCRQLVMELTEWARIVNGGRMSTINKERSKGLVRVFNLLKVVVESLGVEYKTVERYFSQERQNYFSRLLSNIHLAHGVKDLMRLLEMDDVISLTTGILLMWRHVRIMQSRVEQASSADTLPLSLYKWVLEPPSTDLRVDETYQFGPDLIHEKCWSGIGGIRRVKGILAGLTYTWFRERCNEWKAEKASQELLTAFDTDLLTAADSQNANASTSGTNKSNKKSKKKKNKKSSSLANGSNTNPASSLNENNDETKPNADKLKEVATDDGDDQILSDMDSVDQDPIIDSTEVISKGNDDTSNANEATESIDGGDDKEFLHSEQQVKNSIEDYEPSVVVKDESGREIPAMEFLTDRLLALLNQPENEQVVIISS